MKKKFNSQNIKLLISKLSKQIIQSEFKPTVILGIGRGGIVPAVMLSHKLNDIPVASLMLHITKNFTNRDTKYDFISNEQISFYRKFEPDDRILIMEDIVDEGYTIDYMQDLLNRWLPYNKVKFACLILKNEPKFVPDYFGQGVMKNVWVDLFWEDRK